MAHAMQVSELMTVAVVALPPIVRVRDLVDTLRSCTHQVHLVSDVTVSHRQHASSRHLTERRVAIVSAKSRLHSRR